MKYIYCFSSYQELKVETFHQILLCFFVQLGSKVEKSLMEVGMRSLIVVVAEYFFECLRGQFLEKDGLVDFGQSVIHLGQF